MSKERIIGSDMSKNVRLNGHPFFENGKPVTKWIPSDMSEAGRQGIIVQAKQAEVVK